jgi:hypothetical protein
MKQGKGSTFQCRRSIAERIAASPNENIRRTRGFSLKPLDYRGKRLLGTELADQCSDGDGGAEDEEMTPHWRRVVHVVFFVFIFIHVRPFNV